ncbi:MAG: DNA mismatch endonuclease Vsr [Burkholderiales bacterium]|nr:DNA mismatch endonuclease Vsr [Burkholderiales bacterium]
MTDTLTKAERSLRMRKVRQRDTSLELLVRSELHRRGLRYCLGGCDLPGRPDMVLPGRKAVVFVHGCFWHAHDCRLGRRPSSNAEFWEQKALSNGHRDAQKEGQLRALGWTVHVVWQCEFSDRSNRSEFFDRLAQSIRLSKGSSINSKVLP